MRRKHSTSYANTVHSELQVNHSVS